MARYYEYGAAGRMNLDELPYTGFQNTWSVKPAANPPYKPAMTRTRRPPARCGPPGRKTIDETGNRPANEPSLPAMTSKAIKLLEGDKDGFFPEDASGGGNPTGYSSNLITADGSTMRVSYSTAGGHR